MSEVSDINSIQKSLQKVFWYNDGEAVCWQVTQENKEAEEIQAVVSQEEQSASQQGAKTAALKGMRVNCSLKPPSQLQGNRCRTSSAHLGEHGLL